MQGRSPDRSGKRRAGKTFPRCRSKAVRGRACNPHGSLKDPADDPARSFREPKDKIGSGAVVAPARPQSIGTGWAKSNDLGEPMVGGKTALGPRDRRTWRMLLGGFEPPSAGRRPAILDRARLQERLRRTRGHGPSPVIDLCARGRWIPQFPAVLGGIRARTGRSRIPGIIRPTASHPCITAFPAWKDGPERRWIAEKDPSPFAQGRSASWNTRGEDGSGGPCSARWNDLADGTSIGTWEKGTVRPPCSGTGTTLRRSAALASPKITPSGASICSGRAGNFGGSGAPCAWCVCTRVSPRPFPSASADDRERVGTVGSRDLARCGTMVTLSTHLC